MNQLETIVQAVLSRLGNPADVVAHLKKKLILNDRKREIALQVLLTSAVEVRNGNAQAPDNSTPDSAVSAETTRDIN